MRARLAPLLVAHDGDVFGLAVGNPRESEAKGIYGKTRVVMNNTLRLD